MQTGLLIVSEEVWVSLEHVASGRNPVASAAAPNDSRFSSSSPKTKTTTVGGDMEAIGARAVRMRADIVGEAGRTNVIVYGQRRVSQRPQEDRPVRCSWQATSPVRSHDGGA